MPLYTPKGKRNLAQPSTGYPPGWHPSAATSATTSKAKAQKPKVVAAERTSSQAIEKPKVPAHKPQPQTAEKSKKEKKDVASKADPVEEINEKLQDASLIDPTIEISKRLKRLRRRLRESEQLEEKIKSGEMTNSDQLEKCSRKTEIEDEINQLEDERNKLRQLKASKNT